MQAISVPDSFARLAAVFCGCGQPELAWATVQDYLEEFSLVDNQWDQRTLKLDTGEQYIVAYLLTHLGLIEHGSAIGGSWTTPAGKEVLAFLQQYGAEWQDNETYEFLDSRGAVI